MERSEISSADILSWSELEDVGHSFEKLGFNRDSTSNKRIVLSFAGRSEGQVLIQSIEDIEEKGREFSDKFDLVLLINPNFEKFALIGRISEDIGTIQYHEYHFNIRSFEENAEEKYDILEVINGIDPYKLGTIEDVFNINETIEEFHQDCEFLLSQIQDNISSEKSLSDIQRDEYAQAVFQRIVYSFLVQEKDLLTESSERPLRRKHAEIADQGDVYYDFYSILFSGRITELFPDAPEELFNIQLFSDSSAESEDEFLRIGQNKEESEAIFDKILRRLESWDWQTDVGLRSRRIDALSPLVIGAAFERSVRSGRDGVPFYTPRSFTEFARRRAIIPTLEDELQAHSSIEATSLDEILALCNSDTISEEQIKDLNQFYSDVLSEFLILDPAMGGGSYIKEALDTLIEIRLPILRTVKLNKERWEGQLSERIEQDDTEASLRGYALRDTVSQNIHGVDIDPRAIQATIFRIYLDAISAVPHDEKYDSRSFRVPHVGVNLYQGNPLFGMIESSISLYQTDLSEFSTSDVNQLKDEYRNADDLENAVEIITHLRDRILDVQERADEQFRGHVQQVLDRELSNVDYSSLNPFHWPVIFPQAMESGGFNVVLGNLHQDYENQLKLNFAEQDLLSETERRDEYKQPKLSKIIHEYLTSNKGLDTKYRMGRAGFEDLFWYRSLELTRDSGRVCLLFSASLLDQYSTTPLRKRLIEYEKLETMFSFTGRVLRSSSSRNPVAVGTVQRTSPSTQFQGRFGCTNVEMLSSPSEWVKIPTKLVKDFSPNNYQLPQISGQSDVEVIDQLCNHPVLAEPSGYDLQPMREIVRSRDQDVVITDSEKGDYPILSGKDVYLYSYDSKFREESGLPERWGVESSNAPPASAKEHLRNKRLKKVKNKLNRWLREQDKPFSGIDDYLQEIRGEALTVDEIHAPFELPRIAYRDVARGSDERTMIATVVPPGIPCLDTLHVVEPVELNLQGINKLPNDLYKLQQPKYEVEELLALTGLLNSLPFDYLIRKRIGTGVHLSNYIVQYARAPILENRDIKERIARNVAKLNCYGDGFSEFRSEIDIDQKEVILDTQSRSNLMIEIDILAFQAFGFENPEHVNQVIHSFRGIGSPRVVTSEYLRSVRNQFQEVIR